MLVMFLSPNALFLEEIIIINKKTIFFRAQQSDFFLKNCMK